MSFTVHGDGKLLTVVVPTLNSAATLDWTLASLCSARRVRVIVVDSYSSDSTLEICAKWKVEVISEPAGNMYRAINAGLQVARTDWLAYVNSDDWVFTAYYLKMLEWACNSDADIVYGSADYVDASGRFLFSSQPSKGATVAKRFKAGVMAFTQTAAIFRRTAWEVLEGFDERYRAASDLDFFCRAALLNLKFGRFGLSPVAAFRLHRDQISAATDWSTRDKAVMRGQLRLRTRFADRCSFLLWRISNLPWYGARILRSYELSGTILIQKSTAPPKYE